MNKQEIVELIKQVVEEELNIRDVIKNEKATSISMLKPSRDYLFEKSDRYFAYRIWDNLRTVARKLEGVERVESIKNPERANDCMCEIIDVITKYYDLTNR